MLIILAQVTEVVNPVLESTVGRGDNTYLVVAVMIFCGLMFSAVLAFTHFQSKNQREADKERDVNYSKVIEDIRKDSSEQRREFLKELDGFRGELTNFHKAFTESTKAHEQGVKVQADLVRCITQLDDSVQVFTKTKGKS